MKPKQPEQPEQPGHPHLTHLDARGQAIMVDVGAKAVTEREAVAQARVRMRPQTLHLISSGDVPKGDVAAVARVAGLLAAKRTADLIPLCHPLPLTHSAVTLDADEVQGGVVIRARVRTQAQTGVEMEALTAVTVAALTVYDMCKGVDDSMQITDVVLVEKRGGTSQQQGEP